MSVPLCRKCKAPLTHVTASGGCPYCSERTPVRQRWPWIVFAVVVLFLAFLAWGKS